MPPLQLKVGSVLHIPVPQGVTVTSGSPQIASVTVSGGMATIQALKAGSVVLTVAYGQGLSGNVGLVVFA